MVRAYILIEIAAGRNQVLDSIRSVSLMNAKQIVHSLYPSEVMVHIESTDLQSLNQAITQDLATVEGVTRLTTYLVVNDAES